MRSRKEIMSDIEGCVACGGDDVGLQLIKLEIALDIRELLAHMLYGNHNALWLLKNREDITRIVYEELLNESNI